MVEYNSQLLNQTFNALADPTRRQIIAMLLEKRQRRVKDLAEPFSMSLAAVSKHIKVLERSELVQRFKKGREFYLQLNTQPLHDARTWLEFYERFWTERFESLESMLDEESVQKIEKASERRKI